MSLQKANYQSLCNSLSHYHKYLTRLAYQAADREDFDSFDRVNDHPNYSSYLAIVNNPHEDIYRAFHKPVFTQDQQRLSMSYGQKAAKEFANKSDPEASELYIKLACDIEKEMLKHGEQLEIPNLATQPDTYLIEGYDPDELYADPEKPLSVLNLAFRCLDKIIRAKKAYLYYKPHYNQDRRYDYLAQKHPLNLFFSNNNKIEAMIYAIAEPLRKIFRQIEDANKIIDKLVAHKNIKFPTVLRKLVSMEPWAEEPSSPTQESEEFNDGQILDLDKLFEVDEEPETLIDRLIPKENCKKLFDNFLRVLLLEDENEFKDLAKLERITDLDFAEQEKVLESSFCALDKIIRKKMSLTSNHLYLNSQYIILEKSDDPKDPQVRFSKKIKAIDDALFAISEALRKFFAAIPMPEQVFAKLIDSNDKIKYKEGIKELVSMQPLKEVFEG